MSPLVNPLHDILPLLVGSAVAIAFVHLVVRQSEPEKIPPVAKYFNEWGVTIASLMTVGASFVALYYVGFQTTSGVIGISYVLLVFAFLFLIVAFLIPAIINAIPPLWTRTFYPQFEKAQSQDAEEIREAIHTIQDAEETTTE